MSLKPVPGAGAGRKQQPLRKGHSLMDWVRLKGKEKTALAGGDRPKDRKVTPAMLAAHAGPDGDIWMAFQGQVFNISPYLDFHPGGREELLRAAGQDGTELFMKYHPWVNIFSMMDACYVGKLVTPGPTRLQTFAQPMGGRPAQRTTGLSASKRTSSAPQTVSPIATQQSATTQSATTSSTPRVSSLDTPTVQRTSDQPSISLPDDDTFAAPRAPQPRTTSAKFRVEFYESTKAIHVDVFGPRQGPACPVTALIEPDYLRLVALDPGARIPVWNQAWRLSGHIITSSSDRYQVNSFKTSLCFAKTGASQWGSLGSDLGSWSVSPSDTTQHWLPALVVGTHRASAETVFLHIRAPHLQQTPVLPGQHVELKVTHQSHIIIRPYTPIPFDSCQSHPFVPSPDSLLFYIKIYPDGPMSNALVNLCPGESLQMAYQPQGPIFDPLTPPAATRYVMLAAGTGVTPMLQILATARVPCILFVYNTLSEHHEFTHWIRGFKHVTAHFITTQPADTENVGTLQGRLCQIHLQQCNVLQEENRFLACGPAGFIQCCVSLLAHMPNKHIFN